MDEAERQLGTFIARYSPAVAELGETVLGKLRERIPAADVLVYDNYNALAAGFAPDEKARHVILSLAFYPRWVSLFFMKGAALDDPAGLLEGSGSTIRHVKIRGADDFLCPEIDALIAQALERAEPPLNPDHVGRVIVKSVSAKRRPRRPAS